MGMGTMAGSLGSYSSRVLLAGDTPPTIAKRVAAVQELDGKSGRANVRLGQVLELK